MYLMIKMNEAGLIRTAHPYPHAGPAAEPGESFLILSNLSRVEASTVMRCQGMLRAVISPASKTVTILPEGLPAGDVKRYFVTRGNCLVTPFHESDGVWPAPVLQGIKVPKRKEDVHGLRNVEGGKPFQPPKRSRAAKTA